MRSLSFAFLIVTVFFVTVDINYCDIKSGLRNNNTDGSVWEDFVIAALSGKKNATLLDYGAERRNESETEFEELKEQLKESLMSDEGRSRDCLKNMSHCYEKDIFHEAAPEVLSKQLLTNAPILDFSSLSRVSPSCQKQSKNYVDNLQKFKLWALQMYDANAKITSGILSGNVNQFGDFDLCLSSISEDSRIRGKYCLVSLQVEVPQSSYLAALHKLVHSHYHFRSELKDPGHRVPRFSSIQWGLCVPSGCSSQDIDIGLRKKVNEIVKGTELRVKYDVDPDMCYSSEANSYPVSTILAGSIFLGLFALVFLASVYDLVINFNKNEWIVAFSLKKNLTALLNVDRKPNEIDVLHGIRFINALLLIFAHKSMALFFIPYSNRTQMVEFVSKPWTVFGRAASLYTDPFIMLSGILTASALLGRLDKTKTINFKQEYASRLLRIVPTYAALIAFCTFILPWLGSGPLWNLVVTQHSQICKQNWWRNLLFIHNYFGFKDMCLTHTHHVGIDTQLFFISPFLIYVIWKWPRNGTIALTLAATISTVMRYYVTYTMKLSNYIHFETSIKQLFDTADNMYTLPVHRATVYIMGILLAYVLKYYKTLPLSKVQIRIGDALAICSFIASFIGPSFMGSINYIYNARDAAWYAAFAPILWCLAFGWLILRSHLGYESALGKLLSFRGFMIWTRISYTVYLTQFPVFFFNVGKIRSPNYYEFFSTMFNFHELGWIVALSVILTVVIEMPFQNIRNIIFKSTPCTTNKMEQTEKKIS